MSKVYVLRRIETKAQANCFICAGIVSNKRVAKKWASLKESHVYYEYELDDPELLNRIAKENIK